MTIVVAASPGFSDVPDSAFDAAQPVTSADLKAVSENAKFGALRNEQFWGFYKHGEIVNLPVSPIDGYQYSREELLYTWSVYGTQAPPAGALQGTQVLPIMQHNGGAGEMLYTLARVDQATGTVTSVVAYYVQGGSETDVNDGVLMVMTHAQRAR